ncbi:MAG: alpha/beta hydrolase [Planctomycetes bacterium]|nr:alpha/beta hydrolase [Planctomycetota bacterium]MBI3846016.1 alpha/beta hydrolase [Planctomycetota bacterium]
MSADFIETARREGAPTVIFVHGAGGNRTHWGFQMRDLRDAAHLVAVDLPGHGKSAPIADLSIEAYADVVEEVVRTLGSTRVVIAGHSMGGAIALTIGLRQRPWLAGLVLVGTGAKLRVTNAILFGLQADFEGTCRQIVGWSVSPDCPAELRARALADYSACAPDVMLADFRACNAFDVRERVAEIAVPSLVVCGASDQLTPAKFSEFLAEKIAGSTLEVVAGSGHLVPVEKPDAMNAALRRFLTTLR